MKRLIFAAAAALLFSSPAFAQPYHHYSHHDYSYWHHRAYYRPHEVHCRYAGYAHGRRVYECHY